MSLRNGAVIYQGYPLTFADGNGDGIGDFIGAQQRLDYLQQLGVSGIWMSPFYESPGKDGGYDVSDYLTVNEALHGSQASLYSFINSAKERGIDFIADFVPSHSSDQHPFFQAALQNPTDTTYIFRDSDGQGLPNNWLSVFPERIFNQQSGKYDLLPDSVWRRVSDFWPHAHPSRLKQYCLTNFAAYQPNWNHEDPKTRHHLQAALGFWLAKGVAGFRFDAIDYMDHDRSYQNELPNPSFTLSDWPYDALRRERSMRGPNALGYLRQLLRVLEQYPDSYALLESYPDRNLPGSDPISHYMKYYREIGDEYPGRVAPFCFEITDLPWDASKIKPAIETFLSALRPSDIAVFPGGNHDKDRIASRYGEKAARAAAIVQLTLPGVAVIYQGDELGMTNHTGIPRAKLTDPYLQRDVSRSPVPMHANDARAGYSTADPKNFRLPIHPEYKRFNVETQRALPDSTFTLYKALIALRKQRLLNHPRYASIETGDQEIYAFARNPANSHEALLTVANCSPKPKVISLHDEANKCEVVLSSETVARQKVANGVLRLNPNEAVVLRPTA